MTADRGLSVLLVSPDSAGGIGRHVQALAQGLVRRGARVTICAPAGTASRFDLAATGAEVVHSPVGQPAGLRDARRVLRQLAATHDVTHAHGVRAAAVAAAAGVPSLVATWHNAPLGGVARRALHRGLEVYSARRSALVLGASADLVLRARAAGARRTALCEVAAPPLTGSAPSAPVDPPATEAGRAPVVLAVGRLHPQKRFDLLIDVAGRWAARASAPQVLIAGDGPAETQLRAQAERLRAPVHFLGARSDVASLLADADLVVLPSDWEARPLVAQEALRAGVPLVATDVGGVRDLVGDAAVLVPPGDVEALARGIERVLHDDALRSFLRDAGPLRAATWPSVDDMVDRLWQQYLDLHSTFT